MDSEQSISCSQCDPCCQQASERQCDPALTAQAELFKALGDESRLAILHQLREQGATCATDLIACCAVAQPTVSHHLRVLRRAGLVRTEKRGLWVYFTLNEERLAALRAMIP